jgi:hypothetical protein
MTFSLKNEWKTKRKGWWPPLKANETNKLSEKNILTLKLPIEKC